MSKIGVYTLEGVPGENAVRVKYIDTVEMNEGDTLKDTQLECYEIKSFFHGEVYACNISNYALTASKKQPVLYVSVFWTQYLKKTLMYKIYVYFNIESDIKTEDDLLNKPVYGSFSTEVVVAGKRQQLENSTDKFPTNQELIATLVTFTKDADMVELLTTLSEAEEKLMADKYRKEFEYLKLPDESKRISLRDMVLE